MTDAIAFARLPLSALEPVQHLKGEDRLVRLMAASAGVTVDDLLNRPYPELTPLVAQFESTILIESATPTETANGYKLGDLDVTLPLSAKFVLAQQGSEFARLLKLVSAATGLASAQVRQLDLGDALWVYLKAVGK